jgi:hypothetical protein
MFGSVLLGFQSAADGLWLFWLESAGILALLGLRALRDRHPGYAGLAVVLGSFTAAHAAFLTRLAAVDGLALVLLGALALVTTMTYVPVILVPGAVPRLRGVAGRVLTLHVALVVGLVASRFVPGPLVVLGLLVMLRLWLEVAPAAAMRFLVPAEFDREVRFRWQPMGFRLEFAPAPTRASATDSASRGEP